MPHSSIVCCDQIRSAVDAIDWLLANRRDAIRKALNPLDRRDHAKIALRLARGIRGITGPAEANAMRSALSTLDVDWPKLDQKARERVIVTAKRAVAQNIPAQVTPKIGEQFRIFGKPIARNSKRFAIATHGLDISAAMNARDVRIAQFAAQSPLNFIRDEYGKRSDTMGKRVREVVAQGIERGAGSREIVRDLKRQIGDLGKLGRGDFYWEVTALAFTNRARTIGQLNAFNEAGIELYTWESVLDEVTTETCRFLHGKTFNVQASMRTVFDSESNRENPEQLKQTQPWISNGRDEETGEKHMFYRGAQGEKVVVATIQQGAKGTADKIGDYTQKISDKGLQDQGLSMPPIHGLCRSTILPDVTGPQPSTKPPPVAPVAPTPPKPRTPRPIPGRPKPKPKPAPKKQIPEKGVHFDHYASEFEDQDIEARALSAIGECGALPMLERKPLGRLVMSRTVGPSGKANMAIGSGANGQYFSEARLVPTGAAMSRSTLKVREQRTGVSDGKIPKVTDAPTVWSTSESQSGRVNKVRATTVHEVGHHVHMEGVAHKKIAGRRKPVIDRLSATSEFIEIDKIVRKAWLARPARKAPFNIPGRMHRAAITEYSEKNHKEYFAEAFALHFLDPETLRGRDPGAFSMIEQVRKLRGLIEPNRSLIGKTFALIEEAIGKASSTKRIRAAEEVVRIGQETERLFEAGLLTFELLDKLETETEKAVGSFDFGGWSEDFAQYREWLFFPEIVELST